MHGAAAADAGPIAGLAGLVKTAWYGPDREIATVRRAGSRRAGRDEAWPERRCRAAGPRPNWPRLGWGGGGPGRTGGGGRRPRCSPAGTHSAGHYGACRRSRPDCVCSPIWRRAAGRGVYALAIDVNRGSFPTAIHGKRAEREREAAALSESGALLSPRARCRRHERGRTEVRRYSVRPRQVDDLAPATSSRASEARRRIEAGRTDEARLRCGSCAMRTCRDSPHTRCCFP